jgi:small-conductance mechanosensitive channel
MDTVSTAFYETEWFRAVVYLAIAVVLARVVDLILARRDRAMVKLLGKAPHRADQTRYVMIRRLTVIAILFVGVAVALLQFPFVGDLAKAMLASAAIMAGVIGIAARAPLANLVSGVMIAFSQPVRLCDYVRVDDVYGTVEQISLTYTFIRTADGGRVVIPNERFASSPVHNYSMGSPGSMVNVDLRVPVGADIERLTVAMTEVGEALAPPPEDKQTSVECAEVGDGGVLLRLHAWAADPVRRRELSSDLRIALIRRLTDDGLIGAGAADGDG